MNRILLEKTEISHDGLAVLRDERAAHIINILHSEPGDTIKTGEIDGLSGTGRILDISSGEVRLQVNHDTRSLEPWVNLVLAPPRPRVMKRLLPQLASLGVGRIVLVGAKKVEKDFWGATLLKEEIYRPLLIDGLMQAGTTILPKIEIRRRFRAFLREELDVMLPSRNRIVAHPYDAKPIPPPPPEILSAAPTVAIGPEGGWTDDEVELLENCSFRRFSLGNRILRSDTAIIAILARLMPVP